MNNPVNLEKGHFVFTRLKDLLNEADEDKPYLWENTLIKGGLSILVAKPKVGKSTLARNLALAIAKGEPAFLGRSLTGLFPVVYLALEEKRSEVKKHFERMGATDDLPIFLHTGSAPEHATDQLGTAILQNKAEFAIIDTLQGLCRIRDLNDYSLVSVALEPIMQIARDTNCHIMLIHHEGKGLREGGDSILGSTAVLAKVDCALLMKRKESFRTIESIQRYGIDLPRTLLSFEVESGLTKAGETVEDYELDSCRKAILNVMSDKAATEAGIKAEISNYTGGTISRSLRLLSEEGKIHREGTGRKGNPYLYSIAENTGNSRNMDNVIPRIPAIPVDNCKVEVGNTESKMAASEILSVDGCPTKPSRACHNCGNTDYWLREASFWDKAEWLCSWCHPDPTGGSAKCK